MVFTIVVFVTCAKLFSVKNKKRINTNLFGFVTKKLNHSGLNFSTLTALKSLGKATAKSMFLALLVCKITSPAMANLFRNNAFAKKWHKIGKQLILKNGFFKPNAAENILFC